MKKFLSLVVLMLVFALAFTMFTSCDILNDLLGNGNQNEDPDTNKVTVCWYQGSKLLKEEKIEKGSKVASWTPEAVEGKEFIGWFSEASTSEGNEFNFDAAINEDTDIFAKFLSNEHVNDENEYYLIGTGSGDMGKAAWDHAKAAANLSMTKEDDDKANIYKITLKMYAGDMFQICYGASWDGQVGIGFVEGAEYCDGVNFYDNATYTAADKKVAQVKNADGEVVFIGSDEYNKGYEAWNVKLAEGMDGIYEITYTTYPSAKEKNTITYELKEAIEPLTSTHNMHFIGTHNEWSENLADDTTYALKESDDKATWTGIITITEDMYADWTADENGNLYAALKLFNVVDGQYYGIANDNILLTAGTYAFRYTVEGNVVEYAKCDYYFVGTFVDGEGNAVNFSVKDGVTPSLTLDGTTATGTLVATDVTSLGDFSWIADQSKPGVFAFKIVYGSEFGIDTWYSDEANGGDNWYVQAGTYTVTIDLSTKTVTIA